MSISKDDECFLFFCSDELDFACCSSDQCVALILKYATDKQINHVNDYLESPLLRAVRYRSLPVIQMLLDAKADVNIQNCRILEYAASRSGTNKYHVITKLLIAAKADLTLTDDKGNTVLHQIVNSHHSSDDIFEYLVREGADVNCKNSKGETPLMLMCSQAEYLHPEHDIAIRNKFEQVKSLIELKANVNSIDNNGNSALSHAVNQLNVTYSETNKTLPRFRIINLLINAGANITAKSHKDDHDKNKKD